MTMMSMRPRSVGEILDGAFRLYKQDVGLYVLTALLATLPLALFVIASFTGSDAAALVALVILPVGLVLAAASWAALVHQMNERLDGREPELGSSLKLGVKLFFRVFWGGILAYLVVAAGMLIAAAGAAAGGAVGGVIGGGVVSAALAAIVGIVLLVMVTFRWIAGAALFLPGIVVEGLSGYRSVKRGFELSRGGRGRIVGVLFLSWILIFVPLSATYFVTGTTAALYDPDALANGVISMGQFAVQQLLGMLASGFTTPFLVACILLLYYDQRIRREAYDLEAEADALAG